MTQIKTEERLNQKLNPFFISYPRHRRSSAAQKKYGQRTAFADAENQKGFFGRRRAGRR
jgi:hypothetical protein